MMECISPYALLKASKPKPAPAQASAYDLFSRATQSRESAPEEQRSSYPEQSSGQDAAPFIRAAQPAHIQPEKKTHYIADIHARHSTASRRAGQGLRTL